jgi:hypothetical protein
MALPPDSFIPIEEIVDSSGEPMVRDLNIKEAIFSRPRPI